MEVDHDNDLPLMANSDIIRVRHYMMVMEFNMSLSIVTGEAVLFLDPSVSPDHVHQEPFELILDSRHLEVSSVSEVVCHLAEANEILEDFSKRKQLSAMEEWLKKSSVPLTFKVEPWCIRVSKASVNSSRLFPKVIKIKWTTSKEGKSLMWRLDQDQSKSAFTPAAAVNNRSLFPCQEPPTAMASWQSILFVDKGYSIMCTGDEDALITPEGKHYFYTQMVLPMSTFAVAVGKWQCMQITERSHQVSQSEKPCQKLHEYYPCHIERGDEGPLIPCRLVGPTSLLPKVAELWKSYIPLCLKCAYELIGPHPFQKLDIVIVPRSYSGLGLSSPSLMFVSQSLVLNADTAMLIRLAHEISHSWFGLLIGALDWTEEWLSEGFATFAEDFIHTKAMKAFSRQYPSLLPKGHDDYCSDSVWDELSKLRCLLRYQTLSAELKSTPLDHQIIRPMGGQELRDVNTDIKYVKNGQNPAMAVTQVHYLKGYFLLHYLCEKVGEEDFFAFLRFYVHEVYHGRLVHSTNFLALFFEKCGNDIIANEDTNSICKTWLDTEVLPNWVSEKCSSLDSPLLEEVRMLTDAWLKQMGGKCKKRSWNRRVVGGEEAILEKSSLFPEQLILLLENLINADEVVFKNRAQLEAGLVKLKQIYCLDKCNADIQHRWCELIVHHQVVAEFQFLEEYLVEHQAMGVYLYGEMRWSKNKMLTRLAKRIMNDLQPEMDYDTWENVKTILEQ